MAGFDPGLQVGGGGFGGFVLQAGLYEALAGVAAALEDGTQAELGDGEGIGAGLAPCLEGWPVRQLRLATVEREPAEALAVGRAGISGADHLTQGMDGGDVLAGIAPPLPPCRRTAHPWPRLGCRA